VVDIYHFISDLMTLAPGQISRHGKYKNPRIAITLRQDDLIKLDVLAHKAGKTRSSMLRHLIREAYKKSS